MNKGFHAVNKKDFCSGLYSLSYNELIKKQLQNITFEDICDFPYSDASLFLKGSCELFALALHKQFGYEVYEIVQNDKMIHTFCIAYHNGHKIYVDVRGMTSSFKTFITGVSSWDDNYCIRVRDTKEDEKLNEEWAKEGFLFANAIIYKYTEYYSI